MKIRILLLITLAFIIGIVLDYLNVLDREIGEPLYRLAIFSAIPFFLILVTRKIRSLKAWIRFSSWWLPLTALLIVIAPTSNGTWLPIASLTKEITTWIMGGLFTVISLVIIVRAGRTSRTKAS